MYFDQPSSWQSFFFFYTFIFDLLPSPVYSIVISTMKYIYIYAISNLPWIKVKGMGIKQIL